MIRRKKVLELIGCSNSTLCARVKSGDFPAPHKLFSGGRAVAWFEDEIVAFQQAQAKAGA
jgi:predicted DNA-binding transcriptional regulator AlpA